VCWVKGKTYMAPKMDLDVHDCIGDVTAFHQASSMAFLRALTLRNASGWDGHMVH